MTIGRFILGYLIVWAAVEATRAFSWSVPAYQAHELLTALFVMFALPVLSVAFETIPPVNA